MKYFTKQAMGLARYWPGKASHFTQRAAERPDLEDAGLRLLGRLRNSGTLSTHQRPGQKWDTIPGFKGFADHTRKQEVLAKHRVDNLKWTPYDAIKALELETVLVHKDKHGRFPMTLRRTDAEVLSGKKKGDRYMSLISPQYKDWGSSKKGQDVTYKIDEFNVAKTMVKKGATEACPFFCHTTLET